MVLDRDGFSEVIRPHSRRFAGCWDRARLNFAKMNADSPMLMARMQPRAVAGIIYDLMAHEIRQEFMLKPTPGISVSEKYGRICVSIDGKVTLRFKKPDEKYRARYVPTELARAFFEIQNALIEMPDLATNIVCGYVKDAFGNTGGLFYTCPLKGGNAYVMEASLFGMDDEGGATVDMPVPGPKTPVIVPKVLPAERKEEKRDAG